MALSDWLPLKRNKQNRYYQGPVSDHFDGQRFFMPAHNVVNCTNDFLKWQLSNSRAAWPKAIANAAPDPVLPAVNDGRTRITFIGQATFLIQAEGLNLITDPFFSSRPSPVSWAGRRRVRPAGIAIDDLPKIDAILISHNHYDHMDMTALGALIKRHAPQIITPLGNGAILQHHLGNLDVIERDWGESVQIGNRLSISVAPARHWSKRTFWDRNHALWGAFGFRGDHTSIYFAGDTGYGDGGHFHWFREHFGAPEIALLPIGAYEPRWFMQAQHMNPAEAVKAHLDLNAKASIAMHHGTVQLTDEPIDAPIRDLKQALIDYCLSEEVFQVLEPGHALDFHRLTS